MDFNKNKNLIKILNNGGIVVMPTDTIYGILGSALNKSTVEKIYRIRKRNKNKPFIVLIGDILQLNKFKIKITKKQKEEILKRRMEATTFVLDSLNKDFEYLDRGKGSIAFRIPKSKKLRDLLIKTGPTVAPSANIEGRPQAKNIKEAREYFGKDVDFYLDEGDIISKPSKIIKLSKDGSFTILR